MTTRTSDVLNGNDTTGNGTAGNPYQTLSKSLSLTAAGDIVELCTGQYIEAGFALSLNNVTIRNKTGHTPILTTGAYYQIIAFSKTGGRTNVWECAYAPGNGGFSAWHGETRVFLVASLALVDSTPGSYWTDTTGHKLYINVGGSAPINTVWVVYSGQGVLNNYSGTGGVLSGLTFKWCDNVVLGFGGTITFSNVTINHLGAFGLYASGMTGATFTGCNFADGNQTENSQRTDWLSVEPGSTGTYVFSNCTMTHSRHGINVEPSTPVTITATDCVISECHTLGGGAGGDGINGADSGATYNLLRCNFIDCSHGFLQIEGTGGHVNAKYCMGWLTHDTPAPGYPAWGFIVDGGATGEYYHCEADDLNINVSGGGGTAFLFQTNVNGNVIRNCIAYNSKKGFDRFSFTGTYTEDHNLSYLNTAAGNMFSGGAGDLAVDPQFVNAGAHDYHLALTSPARNAGVAVAGVSDLASGSVQPPDIGYYTRGVTASPDPVLSFASAVSLAVREVKRSAPVSLATAMTTANLANGNRFLNDGKTFLRVKNVGSSPVTVIVDTPAVIDGEVVSDLWVTCPATTGDILIGPYSPYYHQPGTPEIWVTFTGACTVDAFHLSNE